MNFITNKYLKKYNKIFVFFETSLYLYYTKFSSKFYYKFYFDLITEQTCFLYEKGHKLFDEFDSRKKDLIVSENLFNFVKQVQDGVTLILYLEDL
jgi:hypothetical protein